MALGFQDCCNSSSYFYLTGIPASVQQNEIFFIQTLQGETFCATYVTIPSVNYSIPTYTLVTMTEKTSCSNCTSSNACPTQTQLLLSEFGSGTIATSTDCYIKTFFPMVVSCVATPPTVFGGSDGKLALYVVGGIPPYAFYNSTTFPNSGPVSSNFPVGANQYAIYNNVGVGNYPITATDSETNFFINVNCYIEEPPEPQTVSCTSSPTSYENAWSNNGSVTLTINGGVPPFTIVRNNNVTLTNNQLNGTYLDSNLGDGTYTYTVTSSPSTSEAGNTFPGVSVNLSCTVSYLEQIFYPSHLCFSFELCGETFKVTYYQNGTVNNRPQYSITAASRSKLGLQSGGFGNSNITFSSNNGWIMTSASLSLTGPVFENSIVRLEDCTPYTFYQMTSTPYSGSVSEDDLPQDYNWVGAANTITQGLTVTFSPSICQIQVGLNLSTSNLTICSNQTNWSLTFDFFAYGGVGPYTYKYKKTTNQSFTSSNSDIVTLNQNNGVASNFVGNYMVIAVDTGNGNIESSPYTFTVSDFCVYTYLWTNKFQICEDNPSNNEYILNIDVNGSQSDSMNLPLVVGVEDWSYPNVIIYYKKGNNSYSTFTGENPLSIYGNTTNAPNEVVTSGNYGAGIYTFYIYSTTLQMSSVEETVTIAEISCGIPPSIRIQDTQLAVCEGGNGTVEIQLTNPTIGPYQLKVNGVVIQNLTLPDDFSSYSYDISSVGDYTFSIIDANGTESNAQTVQGLGSSNTITFSFSPMQQVNTPSYDSTNFGTLTQVRAMINPLIPVDIPALQIPTIFDNSFETSQDVFNFANASNYYYVWQYFWEMEYTVNGLNLDLGEVLEGIFEFELIITDYYAPAYPNWMSFSGTKLRLDTYERFNDTNPIPYLREPNYMTQQLGDSLFTMTSDESLINSYTAALAMYNEYLITGHLGINQPMNEGNVNGHGGVILPNGQEVFASLFPDKYWFIYTPNGNIQFGSNYLNGLVIPSGGASVSDTSNNPYKKWFVTSVSNSSQWSWSDIINGPPPNGFNATNNLNPLAPPQLTTAGLDETNFDMEVYKTLMPGLIGRFFTSTLSPSIQQDYINLITDGGYPDISNSNFIYYCE